MNRKLQILFLSVCLTNSYLNAQNKKIESLDLLKHIESPYNKSYEKSADEINSVASFTKPTYKSSNTILQQNISLSFSKERGVYPTGFDVTITAPAGYTINYTLDGRFPSDTIGTQYTAPISITQTCVLKAYAYDSNGNSGVQAHTYVLQDNFDNEVRNPEQRLEWLSKDYIINAQEYAKAIAEVPIISISADTDVETDWIQASFEYLDKHIYADHSNFFSNSTSKKYGQASSLQHNAGSKFKFNSDAQVKKPIIHSSSRILVMFFQPQTRYKLSK